MREVLFDLARMHRSAFAHEGQHISRLAPHLCIPRALGFARMHQRQVLARQEAVVDEAVFLDGEAGVPAFKIARAVVLHAVAQGQVLRARRCADRIGLHEAELANRARQGGGLKEGSRHRITAQVVEGRGGHGRIAAQVTRFWATPMLHCSADSEMIVKRSRSPGGVLGSHSITTPALLRA